MISAEYLGVWEVGVGVKVGVLVGVSVAPIQFTVTELEVTVPPVMLVIDA